MNPQRHSILIVDDEPITIRLLGSILEDEFEIFVATNGAQALSRANARPHPDLILLDVMLPDTDGYEICVLLKDNPATREIPVIFLTARDSEEDETQGLEVGAADFITKPIRAEILQARIHTQLALQNQKRQLLESEALLTATLDSTRDGILVVDNLGYILLHNQRLLDLWHADEEAMVGRDVQPYLQQLAANVEDGDEYLQSLHELLLSDASRESLIAFRDGRYLNEHSMPLYKDGRISGRVFSYTDTTGQKQLEEQLREMSITDELTSLYNRRQMNQILESSFRQSLAYGRELGVLLIDVDRFKDINDRHGHDVGDRILVTLAAAMQEHFRSIDYCCRFGGDEFCVVMPNSDARGSLNAAERFRASIEGSHLSGLDVTVSIGIATTTSLAAGDDLETLMKHADQALYQAKHAGRNRVEVAN